MLLIEDEVFEIIGVASGIGGTEGNVKGRDGVVFTITGVWVYILLLFFCAFFSSAVGLDI